MGGNRTRGRRALLYVVLGALYFFLSFPFHRLVFLGGHIEMRFSGFVPMVAGLLLGPGGAAMCGALNLVADALDGLAVTDWFGSAGVFLMGWLPYRMWATLFCGGRHAPSALDSPLSVIRFVLVAFVASTCAAAFAACGGQLSGQFGYSGFFLEVCLQYFDLSVVVGLPLYQALTFGAGIVPLRPRKAYAVEYKPRRYVPDYALAGAATALAWIMLANGSTRAAGAQSYLNPWCVALLALVGILACLPLARSDRQVRPAAYRRSSRLEGQVILIFTILFSVFISFYALILGMQLEKEVLSPSLLWHLILANTGVAQSVLVCVLSFALQWLHRHTTRPIWQVASYVDGFVRGGSLRDDELAMPRTGNEIDTLALSVNDMARDVRRYMADTARRAAEEERERAEMDVARQIQLGTLPQEPLKEGDTEICASMEPARAVGGDLFDYRDLGAGRCFFAVGDVSGKGVTAALLMMRAKTLMQGSLVDGLDALMDGVNNELAANNDNMMFVTIFAGVYDAARGTLEYVNAGHNRPVLWQDGEGARFLVSRPQVAAGVMEGISYTVGSLEPGDDFALLVYSDGITEAQDAQERFYGDQRLLDVAQRALSGSAAGALDSVRADVASFVGDAEQADDMTMLCLRHKRAAQPVQ